MTLDFLARGAVQLAVGYVVASTIVSLAVVLLGARAETRSGAATTRARRLFALRLAPATAGTTVALLGVLPSYWWLEPRGLEEPIGVFALSLAACAVVFLLGAAWCAVEAVWAARVVARALEAAASRRLNGLVVPAAAVDVPFPAVALVGLVKPRLFVATQVLQACSESEWDAIVRHEVAHLHARDNLRHLCLRACADLLAWVPAGRRLERAWLAATEEAADERATGEDPHRRLELAAALVKVARLAPGVAGAPLHASALYRGEPIATRVRALLAPPAAATRPRRWSRRLAASLAALTFATPLLLAWLHAALEWLIAIGR
jgi:Zn-dependent protease with chaperone function